VPQSGIGVKNTLVSLVVLETTLVKPAESQPSIFINAKRRTPIPLWGTYAELRQLV